MSDHQETETGGNEQQQQQQQYVHASPPPDGLMCLCTMEDITVENYVEYRSMPSGIWKAALYEESVVRELLESQFSAFCDRVKKTDCQAELRRLLAVGPPIYVSDGHALPLATETDTYIDKLWFSSSGQEESAKLQGAVEGEERERLWEELKEFIIVEGKEEGDDEEDAKEPTGAK